MTPEEVCKYIIDGRVFDEFPSEDASYTELGRDTWPDRHRKLVALAIDALECDHDWVDATNEVIKGGLYCPKCHAVKADAVDKEDNA